MKTEFQNVLEAIEAIEEMRSQAAQMFRGLKPINIELGKHTHRFNALNEASRRKSLEAQRISREIHKDALKAIEPKIARLNKFSGPAIDAAISDLIKEAENSAKEDHRYGEVLVLETAASELISERDTYEVSIAELQKKGDSLAEKGYALYEKAEKICADWEIEPAKS